MKGFAPIGRICKRERYLGIYDVEIFFWPLDQLYESFSDIGAHQDLQEPNFVLPELLIKELCLREAAKIDHFLVDSPRRGGGVRGCPLREKDLY